MSQNADSIRDGACGAVREQNAGFMIQITQNTKFT